MHTLWQDLRYSVKLLRQRPGFTVVALLALMLGIGANTAIFSVVNAVLLRPLPYKNSEQLMLLSEANLKRGGEMRASLPTYLDWLAQTKSYEELTAYTEGSHILTGQGEPETINASYISANYFSLLGLHPTPGRNFTAEEDTESGKDVVIIGHNLWRRRFNADANVIGKIITLDNTGYEVVGVAPPGFAEPSKAELWTPMMPLLPKIGARSARGAHIFGVIGRLKPSVKPAQAEAELNTIAQRIAQTEEDYKNYGGRVVSLHESVTGQVQRPLWILLVAVGFVLLIACANVANLLLAQATTRRREIAVRLTLGASRGRLMRQLLTESLLLAMIGGGLGLLLAWWGTDLLVAVSAANLPRAQEIGLNARVVLFTLLVSMGTGLIFGLAPMFQATKTELTHALKEGSTNVAGGRRANRLRSLLIVAEVALTFVLLVGAGLMMNSFLRLLRIDPGYQPQQLMSFRINLPSAHYPDKQRQVAFFKDLIDRIETIPGVRTVGGVTNLPTSGQNMTSPVQIEGRPANQANAAKPAQYIKVERNYFQAMGIPLLRGRLFSERDTPQAPPVVIINEALARQYFPGEDPIGKRMKTFFVGRGMREIIGVVGDVRHSGPIKDAPPQVYEPFAETPSSFMSVIVRSDANRSALIAAVRSAVQSIDPDQPIDRIAPMTELLSDTIAEPRLYTLLLGLFAVIAGTLAVVGIYGVMSYTVTQNTREIGIRMALGAQQHDVLRLVLSQGMLVVGLGLVLGIGAALALTRLMTSLLYGVKATDPTTFTLIALLLVGVALLACYLPAHRATKVDPMVALRYE